MTYCYLLAERWNPLRRPKHGQTRQTPRLVRLRSRCFLCLQPSRLS